MKIVTVCTNCVAVLDSNSVVTIFSYDTPVVRVDGFKVERLWDGWSATTQKHINKVFDIIHYDHINKAKWLKMPVVE